MNTGNEDDMADMRAIASMLAAADKAGMSVEVIMSYGNYIKNGDSIQEAARCATYDWDC